MQVCAAYELLHSLQPWVVSLLDEEKDGFHPNLQHTTALSIGSAPNSALPSRFIQSRFRT